jgi:hypothetical protein
VPDVPPNLPILAAAAGHLSLITTIAAAFTAAWVLGIITQRLRQGEATGDPDARLPHGPP